MFARAWLAAWARTRSWAALLAIAVGVAALYIGTVERLRPQLAWIVPLVILIALMTWYLPKTIVDLYRELEHRVDVRAGGLAGKFFHTFHANGPLQYQGQVLREENGRLFVQLYEPLFGEASTQQFLTDEQVASARFYDSDDEWRSEGERFQRRDAPRRRDR